MGWYGRYPRLGDTVAELAERRWLAIRRTVAERDELVTSAALAGIAGRPFNEVARLADLEWLIDPNTVGVRPNCG